MNVSRGLKMLGVFLLFTAGFVGGLFLFMNGHLWWALALLFSCLGLIGFLGTAYSGPR